MKWWRLRRRKTASAQMLGTALRWPGSMNVVGKRGPAWEESAVGACVRYASDMFAQATLRVIEPGADVFTPVEPHPLTDLLRRPNPWYSAIQLWSGTVLSLLIDGNAYWRVVRDARGGIVELWYVPHDLMAPLWRRDSDAFIDGYAYIANGAREVVPISDVVHFRVGMDPTSHGRLGISRLKPVMQEVLTDAEAAVAAYSMMRSRGIPGAIARPAKSSDEIVWSDDQMAAINYRWEQITGEGRGGLLLLNLPIDVDFPTLDVERMAFEKIRAISAERICAAVGLDPMVLGLSSTNKTYSNYAEARQAAFESFVVPLQRNIATTLAHSLLPQLTLGTRTTLELAFDNRALPVFESYETARAERIGQLYARGVIARRQAQRLLGLQPPDDDDLYVNDAQRMETVRARALRQAVTNARWARELEESGDGGS